ncbi:response regulator, partial [Bacteroidota bacterium]
VEDNADLRIFIAKNLKTDYNVVEAIHGQMAIELVKNCFFDLIITDIMMPNVDGVELCNILKSNINYCHIPIILLTAKNSIESKIEGYKTGADDFIEKPFDMELLQTRILNLIDSRIKLKQLFSSELIIDPSKTTTNSLDEEFLKKAIDVVENNYSNSRFGVEEFVEKMCVSRSLLHKKLSVITDQSASTFITSFRLKKSISLLKSHKDNISQIAYDVGFNDPKYFSRIFKKNYGLTPTDYQNKK